MDTRLLGMVLQFYGTWNNSASGQQILDKAFYRAGTNFTPPKFLQDDSVPKTSYVRDIIDNEPAIDFVGGLPVVIKVTQGTQGQGYFCATLSMNREKFMQGLLLTGKSVLIQNTSQNPTRHTSLVVGDKLLPPCERAGKRI